MSPASLLRLSSSIDAIFLGLWTRHGRQHAVPRAYSDTWPALRATARLRLFLFRLTQVCRCRHLRTPSRQDSQAVAVSFDNWANAMSISKRVHEFGDKFRDTWSWMRPQLRFTARHLSIFTDPDSSISLMLSLSVGKRQPSFALSRSQSLHLWHTRAHLAAVQKLEHKRLIMHK